MTPVRRGGGGHATAGGVDFQIQVAAFLITGMLAESDFEPPWEWPREATIESVRSETAEPVDDVWVETSSGARAYVQAKTSLSLEAADDSEFAKTLSQFANQYISCRDGTGHRRPLELENDRLVLAVGATTPASIRVHLPALLNRLRNWPDERPLSDAPANDDEARALTITTAHLTATFRERTGSPPSDSDLRTVLCLMRVTSYEFGDGGSSEREALGLLRTSVLREPARVGDAWNALCRETTAHAAGQSGMDRGAAQQVLRRQTIDLQAPRSYRADIEKLRRITDRSLAALEGLSDIALRDGHVKIVRTVPDELARVLGEESCVVVGDPGAGKSATLFEVAHRLREEGADVVVLAADRLESSSTGALRTEFNLERDVTEILANWPSSRAVLLIDALDAARGDRTQRALLDLIEETSRAAPNWRIVASIRRFDLRYNPRLRDLFPRGATPAGGDFADPEFADVGHINVALLSADELAQLQHLAPDVHAFLESATPEMRDLVRIPFNLRLLAQLLDGAVDPAELHPIRTQLELLDAYWERRVLSPAERADVREALLRRVCGLIVERRSMRVSRADLQSDGALVSELHPLLSAQVLSESELPDGGHDRDAVGFAHHVLFDYAGARLVLRRPNAEVVAAFVANPDLTILLRPSLDLHMRWLWERSPDHGEFWELTLAIAGAGAVPAVAILVGTGIGADLAQTTDDLAPLIDALAGGDGPRQQSAEDVLGYVLASAEASSRPLVGSEAGPWPQLLARLSDL